MVDVPDVMNGIGYSARCGDSELCSKLKIKHSQLIRE